VRQPQQFGRLWWLPANGRGNGLDDSAWAPLLELSGDLVPAVLAALRGARVPAYAAPAHAAPAAAASRRPRRATRPASAAAYRLWVGASGYSRAQDVLMTVLPALTRRDRYARS
jgi:hypothetical protein